MRVFETKSVGVGILFSITLAGVLLGFVSWQSAILLSMFLLSVMFFQRMKGRHKSWALILWLLSVVLGVLIGMYRPENFHDLVLFKVEALYAGGHPFQIDLNLVKLLAGYAILLLVATKFQQEIAWVKSTALTLLLVGLFSVTIISLAYVLLNLDVHFKLLKHIFIFSLFNFFAVCVVEEAFMRLLLQQQIKQFLSANIRSKFFVEAISLAVVTLIFVLTHGVNSLQTIIVFGVAGFFYGMAYSLTRRLWPSVALHFLVNFLHFSFLTYPLR